MPHRILVVDDDLDTRLMMDALLTGAGYETTTAGTLHAALDALTSDRPDLLITDVRLNGYNGLQLLATSPSPVPAIVITGVRDQVIEAEARRHGAAFIVKPLWPAALLHLIGQKLAGGEGESLSSPPRRWTRRPVTRELRASISGFPVRIVDVSHGGLRFECERAPGQWLPLSFTLDLPTWYSSIGVDVVWKRRAGESRWMCGATVSDNRPAWREIVDATS